VNTYILKSSYCEVTILDFGARLHTWNVLVEGQVRSISLHYPDLNDYRTDPFYIGAICGPYANRIAEGKIDTHSSGIQLSDNDGENHLHGGISGLDKMTWNVLEHTENQLTLAVNHVDGQDGYPGNKRFVVEYHLSETELRIKMQCETDKRTVVGPTGHGYFNLNGVQSDLSGLDQYLQTEADKFTPLGLDGIPIDGDQSVESTELDMRTPVFLKDKANADKLDNNFVFSDNASKSLLTSKDNKLSLLVTSDYPAVQLYSGFYLGGHFNTNQGVCVEPHYGANAPNRDNQYDWLVSPEKPWKKHITYQLKINH
jgi:aldose 1-epimerase